MNTALSFGNRERDDEIRTLYRRIEDLEATQVRSTTVPVVTPQQLSAVGSVEAGTADETTTTPFQAARMLFDQAVGFTVTEDGETATISGSFGGVTIGAAVGGGTSPAVLYVGAGNVVAQDPTNLYYDATNRSLIVRTADASVAKAVVGTETTTATNNSFSTITAERKSSNAVVGGFGVGIGFNVGSSGGASSQWGAITSEYDGGVTTAKMVFRVSLAGTAVVASILGSNGQHALQVAGAGYSLKDGSNCKMGQATLVAGTVTVSNTSVTSSSRIFLQGIGTTNAGDLGIGTITNGTSFVINSNNASDARTVNYLIMEPS